MAIFRITIDDTVFPPVWKRAERIHCYYLENKSARTCAELDTFTWYANSQL